MKLLTQLEITNISTSFKTDTTAFYEVLQFMKIGLIRSESSLPKFDWLSPYLECCHSWGETFGVTWEHGALPDIVKIQVQHDHSLKAWEGRKRKRVNVETNQNTIIHAK